MQEILDNAHVFNNGYDRSSVCDDVTSVGKRPPWRRNSCSTLASTPHSDMMVTHVNQTMDLLNGQKFLAASPGNKQSSEEWLETHGLSHQALTLKDLLKKGSLVKRHGDVKHLMFKAIDIAEMEYKLNEAIEIYHKRVKWLLEGSRKQFGLVKGKRVAVLIDSSDDNIGFGRIDQVQRSLMKLIDDQLQDKKSFYFMSIGTEPIPLWSRMRDVNKRTLEEARDFVRNLYPAGGCNLLKALKKAVKLRNVDSIVVVLGSCCDQTNWRMFDFMEQVLLGRELPIQTIAYNTSNNLTHNVLKRLAIISKGRFHCYSATDVREVYKGFDIQMLLRQAQIAVDVLAKIRQMKAGKLGDALVSIESEVALEVEQIPESRFLPRPLNHHRPLSIDTPNFQPITSKKWLSDHGLKAKNLGVYQVLAPNAFDPIQDFVSVLGKSVQSKIHQRAMHQFEWHDGTTKNIHVDVAMLYQYQTLLGAEVKKYERRIEWLSSASRKIWGTICEKRVILMVDTSITNKQFIVHLQHSIRLCLEQQIANKEAFNIIAFGSYPKMWKSHMVKPTPANLQAAWRWTLDLEADGSRNFLSAFRVAVENDDDSKGMGSVQGIYLLTSGILNQEENIAASFISETCVGKELNFHAVLFNIDVTHIPDEHLPSRYADSEQAACYLRNLTHEGNGRFHWFNEKGIVESDDIYLLSQEMEQAIKYSKICSDLVQGVRDRDDERKEQFMLEDGNAKEEHTEIITPFEITEPRHTQLTLARLNLRNSEATPTAKTRPSTAWKVSRRKAGLPEEPYKDIAATPQRSTKTAKKVQKQQFYIDQRSNNVGTVYHQFPKSKSVRKQVPEPIFPQKEERITSKQWIRKYGLNKIKLNLHKYLHGPICRHDKINAKGKKSVTSRWFCSLFPSAVIDGSIRHVDMKSSELEQYETEVMRTINRYTTRLQWLLSGSRRVFGSIVESNVVILIDTSGSMIDYMEELKRELTLLIWQQLREHDIKFNLISFSNEIKCWQDDGTVQPNDLSCHDAVQWASSLIAHGGTATLEALQYAFSMKNIEAIYLLSDGKPDTSCKLTLEQVKIMNDKKKIPIHCVSFKCENNSANEFLRKLASATGGRYHRCHGEDDAQLAIHRMLDENQCSDHDDPNFPAFTGDDVRIVGKEIDKARKYLTQSREIRQVISDYQAGKQTTDEGKSGKDDKRVSNRPFYP